MIEKLKGILSECILPSTIIVDVNGVGYGVEIPVSLMCDLPSKGTDIELWTYTHLRENGIRLFGFDSYLERFVFEILLSLNGVGPKVAMAILSTLNVEAIKNAVFYERNEIFLTVPGIGPRLAEKILVELKPKLKKLLKSSILDERQGALSLDDSDNINAERINQAHLEDVKSALENLGFKEKDILPVMKKIIHESSNVEFTDMMRFALAELGASNAR